MIRTFNSRPTSRDLFAPDGGPAPRGIRKSLRARIAALFLTALAAVAVAGPAAAGDIVFNIAKGRGVEFYNRVESNDPTNSAFIVILLKVAEADSTLEDYDTISALLGGSNTEADFTNSARKTLTDSDLAAFPSPDDTNDRYEVDAPDQTWSSAGGASNNTLVKAILAYDNDTTGGTDANLVPVVGLDFPRTTDGTDLILQFHPNGFFRAN